MQENNFWKLFFKTIFENTSNRYNLSNLIALKDNVGPTKSAKLDKRLLPKVEKPKQVLKTSPPKLLTLNYNDSTKMKWSSLKLACVGSLAPRVLPKLKTFWLSKVNR